MQTSRNPVAICLIALVTLCAPRAAACDLPAGETATVAAVEDGETFTLTDGREVRLLGIKAPAPPLGWRGDDPWPFVAESKGALERLASGAAVELRFDTRRSDRYGHVLAQVYVIEGETRTWAQGALVRDGFARVYSFADAHACAGELLEQEEEARAARRGIWHSWAYRIQDAEDVKGLSRLSHTYQLVEGTVHAVGEGRKWIYVNFAEDWRLDFTIAIARKDLAAFESSGFDFERLPGNGCVCGDGWNGGTGR